MSEEETHATDQELEQEEGVEELSDESLEDVAGGWTGDGG